MSVIKFNKVGTGFTIQYDNGPKRRWNNSVRVTCIEVGATSFEFEIGDGDYKRTIDLASNTVWINGNNVTANGNTAICDSLIALVFPSAAPATALPTENVATYAAMQTSITADPTTKRDFFVSADETNGGEFTRYYYNGTDIYWIPMQTV